MIEVRFVIKPEITVANENRGEGQAPKAISWQGIELAA